MAPDTKRIPGPDVSTPYRLYSELNTRNCDQLLTAALGNDGRRQDGRALCDSRTIFGRLNAVPQSKGSAYVEMGKTKVVVGVYEPREIPKLTTFDGHGELYCEVKFAPFSSVKRCQLQPGSEEKDMAAALKRALEPAVLRHLFPNFQIDIFAYILENDGGCLATVINAASLALADAEIPMYDTVTALTIGIQGDKVFVDPNADEEMLCLMSKDGKDASCNHGLIVKALLPEMGQVTELWQRGAITLDSFLKIVESHNSIYQSIYQETRSLLYEKCQKFVERKKKSDTNKKNCEIEIESLIESMAVV